MVINNMLMQNGSVSIRHDMRSKKNEKAVSMSELRTFVDEGYYALSPAPVTETHRSVDVARLLHDTLDKPFELRIVDITIGLVPTTFIVHVSSVINRSTALVVFDTPGYPNLQPGMSLKYNEESLIMYHFEQRSGATLTCFVLWCNYHYFWCLHRYSFQYES